MDKEKRLTALMIAAVVVVVGAMFLWRYVIDPGVQKAAQERRAREEHQEQRGGPTEVANVRQEAAPQATSREPEGPVAVAGMKVGEAVTAVPPVTVPARERENLLKNSGFADGLAGWTAWPPGTGLTGALSVVAVADAQKVRHALRIENGERAMIGVQQLVMMTSGQVYRLSAQVRSVATNDSSVMFGGRVACYMAGQPEQQLVWMSEYNHWWPKELVFTNEGFAGAAVVYVHMGYGSFASTGEFTDIRLEVLP